MDLHHVARPATKSYRTPRRRPAHLRVKTGCIPCRSSKKRCDEINKPLPCQRCLKRNVKCTWTRGSLEDSNASPSYVSTPAVNEGVATGPHQLAHFTAAQPPSSVSSIVTPASFDSNRIDSSIAKLDLSLHGILTIHEQTLGDIDGNLFNYTCQIFIPSLIRSTHDKSLVRNFIASTLQLAHTLPFYLHALIACAATESGQFLACDVAERHYTHALAGFRRLLGVTDQQHAPRVFLRTVFLLLIYEGSRAPRSSAFSTHLTGAATILLVACNEHSRRGFDAMEPWLIVSLEAFIFHASSAITFMNNTRHANPIVDLAFETAQELLEARRAVGLHTTENSFILGAPPRLFYFVRQITKLTHGEMDSPRELQPDINHTIYDLHVQFEHWRCLEYPLLVQGDDSVHHSITTGQEGPFLYVYVLRLLFSCCQNDDDQTGGPARNLREDIVSECAAIVARIDPMSDVFADYYCWPLYWLAKFITQDIHRKVMMQKVEALYEATRSVTMRNLALSFQDMWSAPMVEVEKVGQLEADMLLSTSTSQSPRKLSPESQTSAMLCGAHDSSRDDGLINVMISF